MHIKYVLCWNWRNIAVTLYQSRAYPWCKIGVEQFYHFRKKTRLIWEQHKCRPHAHTLHLHLPTKFIAQKCGFSIAAANEIEPWATIEPHQYTDKNARRFVCIKHGDGLRAIGNSEYGDIWIEAIIARAPIAMRPINAMSSMHLSPFAVYIWMTWQL